MNETAIRAPFGHWQSKPASPNPDRVSNCCVNVGKAHLQSLVEAGVTLQRPACCKVAIALVSPERSSPRSFTVILALSKQFCQKDARNLPTRRVELAMMINAPQWGRNGDPPAKQGNAIAKGPRPRQLSPSLIVRNYRYASSECCLRRRKRVVMHVVVGVGSALSPANIASLSGDHVCILN